MIDNYGYSQIEIERRGHWTECRDGELIYSDKVAIDNILNNYNPIPAARADAILRINDQSQALMQSVELAYPEFEKRTWPTQKQESDAWVKDSDSKTPMLDAIALSRGINRITLLNKTVEKVNQYNLYAAELAGKRQKIEEEILNSNDLDFICTVSFEA